MERRAGQAIVQGVAKSDMTEQLTHTCRYTHTHTHTLESRSYSACRNDLRTHAPVWMDLGNVFSREAGQQGHIPYHFIQMRCSAEASS